MCRAITNVIKLAQTWFSPVSLDVASKEEVTWWLDNLKNYSNYPIIIDNTTVKIKQRFPGSGSLSLIWIGKLN